jgi:peptide/nickel transport system ATP-binding protein
MNAEPLTPVLEARNLVKEFRFGKRSGLFQPRPNFRAVDDVSLSLYPGQVTALVGQSGSGKSTVARMLAQLYPVTSGEILLDGKKVKAAGGGKSFVDYCGSVQMILQDPFASLNPVHRVRYILSRAVKIHDPSLSKSDVLSECERLLERVNLLPTDRYLDRYPHELSGGERQRVSFARGLAARPRVLLADEPVSALDVTIRKEMLDLLDSLRFEDNLAILYVTHDLNSAYTYSDTTMVMFHGKVVEHGPSKNIIADPQHEYTRRLLAAAPDPARRRRRHFLKQGVPL